MLLLLFASCARTAKGELRGQDSRHETFSSARQDPHESTATTDGGHHAGVRRESFGRDLKGGSSMMMSKSIKGSKDDDAPDDDALTTPALIVVNSSPIVDAGPTVYVTTAQQNITVFYPGVNCNKKYGCITDVKPNEENIPIRIPDRSYRIGIQWDISRIGQKGDKCDQTCRQIDVTVEDGNCQFRIVGVGEIGYCNPKNPDGDWPTWTPDISMTPFNGGCRLVVGQGSSVDGTPDLCGCDNGRYPCDCGSGSLGCSFSPPDASGGPNLGGGRCPLSAPYCCDAPCKQCVTERPPKNKSNCPKP